MRAKITNNGSTTWEIEANSFDELLEEVKVNPYNSEFNKIEFENGYTTTYYFVDNDEEYDNYFYNEVSDNTDIV